MSGKMAQLAAPGAHLSREMAETNHIMNQEKDNLK